MSKNTTVAFEQDGILYGSDGSAFKIKTIEDDYGTFECGTYLLRETVIHCAPEFKDGKVLNRFPKIERVFFNGPATIVFWDDGVKTVAKCDWGDKYDIQRGIERCMMKRMFGNSYQGYLNAMADALSVAEVQR